MTQVLVDADACPVKRNIVRVAKQYGVSVTMVLDTSHQFQDGYSRVILVDKARDSADMKLISLVKAGDIVVTQDYGVATMALTKSAIAIHHNGFLYNEQNIDQLLFERYLSQKARRIGNRRGKIRKRTNEDNEAFERLFKTVLRHQAGIDEVL